MQPESKRGGARPGSGRPPLGASPRVHGTFMLDPELARAIAERADSEGVSRSEALSRCLREWREARG